MNSGRVFSINVSSKKGTPKRPIEKAFVIANFGIKGDAHAGSSLRQVSLLSWEAIQSQNFCPKIAKSKDERLGPGDFAENITTQQFNLSILQIGDRIKIGEDVILQVTQIGKKCHNFCEIYKKIGKCIMPKQGIFAKVLQGGWIKKGDSISLMKNESRYNNSK